MSAAPLLRPQAERIPYEPALDGLRGLAVLGIAAYHAGLPWAQGGFLGVSAFFVLSGYLITRLLLAEWERDGHISLRAFWGRRARRLLPAVLLLLATLLATGMLRPDLVDLAKLRGDLLSTLFYFNNWFQIAEGRSYFDLFAAPSPLHHAWSLALEEQWFLFFPVAFQLLLRRGLGPGGLALWLALGALLSSAWAAWLYDPALDPSRIYYGTDTRAQELLVGGVLACGVHSGALRDLPRRAIAVVGVLASLLLLLAWSQVALHQPLLYRGGLTLAALLTASVILASTNAGPNPLRSLLSLAPLRGLGVISYGVYLWHWPVYLLLTTQSTGLRGASLLALRAVVAVGLAGSSYAALERPIRRGRLPTRIALAVALASTLAIAFGVVWAPAWMPETRTRVTAASPVPTLPTEAFEGEALSVLFVGDSVAWSLANGFVPSIERRYGVSVENRAILGCGLSSEPFRVGPKVYRQPAGRDCPRWPEHWARHARDRAPDVAVVMIGAWDLFDRELDGEWIEFGSPALDAQLAARLSDATRALSSGAGVVVWLSTPDFAPYNPDGPFAPVLGERWRVAHLNRLIERHVESARERVAWIDLAAALCADGDCGTDASGTRLRTDGIHFDTGGSRLVARWLAPRLRRALRDSEARGAQR